MDSTGSSSVGGVQQQPVNVAEKDLVSGTFFGIQKWIILGDWVGGVGNGDRERSFKIGTVSFLDIFVVFSVQPVAEITCTVQIVNNRNEQQGQTGANVGQQQNNN